MVYRPLIFRPLTYNLKPTTKSKRTILEKGDGPPPTQQQLDHFKRNRKPIIESLLVPQLKKSKDVLHGATSRNTQVQHKLGTEEAKKQNLLVSTYDYDIWSKQPKKRAIEIENKLDKQYNADIAQVEKMPVGKRAPDFKGKPKTKQVDRYTVITPATPAGKQEVDYTSLPSRPFTTNTIHGVRHETISSSYKRAQQDKDIPLRSERAYAEIRKAQKLDSILKRKGRKGVLE